MSDWPSEESTKWESHILSNIVLPAIILKLEHLDALLRLLFLRLKAFEWQAVSTTTAAAVRGIISFIDCFFLHLVISRGSDFS